MKAFNKAVSIHNTWPLTAAQEGILFGQLLAPDSPMYNAAEVIEIKGELDLVIFTRALTQVINAAEALHAQYIYTEDANVPAQQKLQARPWMLHTLDFSDNSHPRAAADAWIKNDVNTVAHLTPANVPKNADQKNNAIFTQAIFVLSPQCFLWYQRIHHIACDGYGFALIAKSVATLYEQLRTHTVIAAPIFGDYKKVIEADGRYKKIQEIQKFQSDKNFWCDVMRNIPAPITLQPIAPLQNTARAVHSILPAPLVAAVKELANNYDSPWTDVLYALCAQWLMFKTGCHHITLGIPVMARMGTPAVRVPAMVMNINPLPIAMAQCENFEQVIFQVTEFQKQARRHQHYRYEQLRRDLIALGSNKRLFGPVVNVMPFNRRLVFGEAISTVHRISAGPVEDLSFSFLFNTDDDLVLSLEANPAAYTSEQLQQYKTELLTLMDFYTQNPTAPLTLDLQRLSYTAGSPLNIPFNPVLNAIFAQANNHPTTLALIDDGKLLNYAQLKAAIEQAAQHIQTAKKTTTACIIAIVASRSNEAIIASLAILLMGDAYVFVDPNAPRLRNQQIIEDAAPAVIIIAEGANIQIPDNCAALTITQLAKPINTPQPLILPDISETTLAYLMYTSGSTGKPKGVKIGHGALASFVQSALNAYGVNTQDKVLQFAPLHFDASIEEIYLTLTVGAQLIVRSDAMLDSMADFLTAINAAQITLLDLPTAFWHELVLYCSSAQAVLPNNLRTVIIGGEAAQPERVKQWHQIVELSQNKNIAALGENTNANAHIKLFNTYGPTETTVVATYAQLLPNTPATIGQPLPGRSVAVVNSAGELIPRGDAGELIILGQGIGLGYHQLPALSAQSFAPIKTLRNSQFSQAYRTGDRVSMNNNGDLIYLGRLDDEVKISGYRINPLEIENALLSVSGIQQAAIVVIKNTTQIILHAFIVADENPHLPHLSLLPQVREQLRQKLPAPMLPAQYHFLAKLPINHNGKVDKKQLQQTIDAGEPQQNNTQQNNAIKLTATEQKIASVWQQVLGVDAITADDDFFILGGQSLQTLQVASRLVAYFNHKINVTTLFKYPTLKQLAQVLDGDNTQPLLDVKNQAQKDSHIHQPAFNPSTLNTPKNQGAIKTILLTGANGFVGVHLLQQLSRRGVNVMCLIRATSITHGEQRLRAAFKAQQLNYSAIAPQVHILIGDAAKPQLGLMPEQYAALINECDAIIHNAATTSVMRDYQSLVAANVVATQECFSLAATAKIAMHLISTIAVAPASGLPEDFVPWHSGLKDGYQQSKWAAENCMANAHGLGYPVSIYRLGRITGSLNSGFINQQDLAWRMIRASTVVGQFPDIALAEPWSPVDQIAQFVALQVLNNQHFGVYNPVPQHSVALSQIFAWLQAAGVPLIPAAMPQWLMQLQNNADEGCQALAGFFEQRRQAGGELFLPLITTTKTQQALKECDVNFQPLTQLQFKRFLDYAIEHQIIEVNELEVV